MEYISSAEARERWGVSLRQVQRLLAERRIPGARKYGRLWMVPAGAKRPIDLRKERKLTRPLDAELIDVLTHTALPMPANNPDAILDAMPDDRLRLIYEGELAYLRGDFQRAIECFRKTQGDNVLKPRACLVGVVAAISMGDYRTYAEIETYLKNCAKTGRGYVSAFAEMCLATVAVSVIAPSMAPDWLRTGDLSVLPPLARTDGLYLRSKYFNCMGNFEASLAVAETALAVCSSRHGIAHSDIYLRLMCASSCRYLGRDEEARRWLVDAMGIALPHGFITPFAELVTAFGGMMEQCLKEEFPDHYDAVINQWKRTWKNWIIFHNQFTKDNITLILSLREYHLASLVAQRIPYAEIAKRHGISVGRLKNIMQEVYSKLHISSRDELVKYVFP